jgi:hypothetical protein
MPRRRVSWHSTVPQILPGGDEAALGFWREGLSSCASELWIITSELIISII